MVLERTRCKDIKQQGLFGGFMLNHNTLRHIFNPGHLQIVLKFIFVPDLYPQVWYLDSQWSEDQHVAGERPGQRHLEHGGVPGQRRVAAHRRLLHQERCHLRVLSGALHRHHSHYQN